jgi:hypothetical protein
MRSKRLVYIWRILIEVGFIVFLFYSNLLMGEYTKTGNAYRHDLWWAMNDIFTATNFAIALVSAVVGHLFFEFFRKKL